MSNPNDPAYPYTTTETNGNCGTYQQVHTGLTKREAFAMAAMQGMIASDAYQEGVVTDAERKKVSVWSLVAADVVLMADALLAELAKEGNGDQ